MIYLSLKMVSFQSQCQGTKAAVSINPPRDSGAGSVVRGEMRGETQRDNPKEEEL